jgi:methionyl-tRNA synthetase
MPEKFYVTTPIYYVNARPHIGHAYTTIVADVLARRHRLLGDDTFFLTGTDEHGQKIERSAAAAGIAPQAFADEVSESFRTLWKRMGITNDAYIRTTDAAHKRGVQKLFSTLYERGAIYLSSYTGQYCVSEEMFVEGPPGTIGPDGRPTETVTEENFFFRLSDYQLPLLNLIESDQLRITPESRKNEVLSFLRGNVSGTNSGAPGLASETWGEAAQTPELRHSAAGTPYVPGALKDLSISRSSFTWGIPVPEPAASKAKEKHVVYVWLDALANYMTALGYGSDSPEDQARFAKYWPADLHLVGKEIIRFHCIYWPAFLLAADLPLPKAVTAHGWLLFEDSKMSKSKGNIVRTETVLRQRSGGFCFCLSRTLPCRPRPLRRRHPPLLPPPRNPLRPGRQLLLRRDDYALQRRPRQRLRESCQPHAGDDRTIFRRCNTVRQDG